MNDKSNSLVRIGLLVLFMNLAIIPVVAVAPFLAPLPIIYLVLGLALVGAGGIACQHPGLKGD